MVRLALLSVHGCPLARLGEKDTGGMNVYVLEVAKELGRRGNFVDVYTRCHDCNDPPIVHLGRNARVIHVKAGPYSSTKDSLYRYLPEFIDNLYRFQENDGQRYDLIHSHYWLSGYAGLEMSRKWGVPHVTTFHTLAKIKMEARAGERESQLRVYAESRVMEGADAVVVSTRDEKEDLARLYGLSPHKVRVIPAGVDLRRFRPLDKSEARQRLGVTETRVVLSVGRVAPLKGFDILLSAMAKLESTEDTRLLIVGGSPGPDREMRRLRSLAVKIGLSDVISFIGAVDQSELPYYYSAADVFVLSSYYESFGLVALEAMACGVPVVASRVGGLKSFIKNGETGYLVPWQSPEPFAQRLETLLADQELKERVGRAALVKARTMGWGKTASHLLDLYSTQVGEMWESAAGA